MPLDVLILLVLGVVGGGLVLYAFIRGHQNTKDNKQVAQRLTRINGMIDIKLDVLKEARSRGTHV